MKKRLLTYAEASEYLSMKPGTLYAMVSRKQIPHVRVSGRCVRFDIAVLDAWLDARRVAVANDPEDTAGDTSPRGGTRGAAGPR